MSYGWEGKEPAPMEYFHGRVIDLFHEFRKTKTDSISVNINGSEFNNIIVKAKIETYDKYPNRLDRNAIASEDC